MKKNAVPPRNVASGSFMTKPPSSSAGAGIELEAFKRAAEEWTRKNTRSPEAARAALAAMGIYTPSGKISKNYKS